MQRLNWIFFCAVALAQMAATAISLASDDPLRLEAGRLFGVLTTSNAVYPAAQATLGRELFWDARISADGKTACASCHLPEDGGADRRRFSPDARGKLTARNSQTVFNSMLQPTLRWTGDRKSGAHQAERSLTGSMGFSNSVAVVPVLKSLGYEPLFQQAFQNDTNAMSPANYAQALEAYQSTLVTPSAFDRYLGGESEGLNAQQRAGLRSFINVGCADCHKGPLLGGRLLKKFGLEKDYWTLTRSEKVDAGLFESTKDEGDRYKFRVPMLRNIAGTAPYFHDGSVAELSHAVEVMAEVQLGRKLGSTEVAEIVAFLQSLTGETPPQFAAPRKSGDE